ncbi:MAG: carbohydrate ABC transporter permease [Anaerolineae bacterium]|nr:carbohydrate ABC transporter permease [Anaerolineae bacterium]
MPVRSKYQLGRLLLSGLQYTVLILMTLVMLIPFAWMFSTSLKTGEYILRTDFIPNPASLDSYRRLFEIMPMGRMVLNSVFITVVGTVGQILFAAMSAYAFARMKWRGRNTVFTLYLATMMIPYQVVVIPQFIMVSKLGWVNSYPALIAPSLFSAFATFLLRQAFLTIPNELEEAAVMDGANHLTIFWRVMLPLVKPVLATLTVFTFMSIWNAYLWPLFVARKQEFMTLPLGLATLQGSNESLTEWNLVMAGAVVTVLPILVIYLFAQEWFVQGAVISGIKG